MSKISKKDLTEFLDKCDSEGFDYALENFEPETSEDEGLKNLIAEYNNAKEELKDYLREVAEEYDLEEEAEILDN